MPELTNISLSEYRGALVLEDTRLDEIAYELLPYAVKGIRIILTVVTANEYSDVTGDKRIEHGTALPISIEKVNFYVLGVENSTGRNHVMVASPELVQYRHQEGLEWRDFFISVANENENEDTVEPTFSGQLQDTEVSEEEISKLYDCTMAYWQLVPKVPNYRTQLLQFSHHIVTRVLERGGETLQQATKARCLAHRASLFYFEKKYAECVRDAQGVLELDATHIIGLSRMGDASVQLRQEGIGLLAYWKMYLVSSDVHDSKAQDYAKWQLQQLWRKGWVVGGARPAVPWLSAQDWQRSETHQYDVAEPSLELQVNDMQGWNVPWVVPLVMLWTSVPSDIPRLTQWGVRLVISLTEDQPPAAGFRRTGVRNVFLPVRQGEATPLPYVDVMLELVLDTFYKHNDRGSTLIHANGNMGCLVACFLLRFGLRVPPRPCIFCKVQAALWCTDPQCPFGTYPVMSVEEAISLACNVRPGCILSPEQERFVYAFASEIYGRAAQEKRISTMEGADEMTPFLAVGTTDRPRCVILMGLPGSGKSWFAEKLASSNSRWVRVSQDALGSRQACEFLVIKSAARQRSIVIDRCNPTAYERNAWAQLANHKCTAIVHFDVPPSRCINRILRRLDHSTLPGSYFPTLESRLMTQMPSSSILAPGICLTWGVLHETISYFLTRIVPSFWIKRPLRWPRLSPSPRFCILA
jgi:hypothetical protein